MRKKFPAKPGENPGSMRFVELPAVVREVTAEERAAKGVKEDESGRKMFELAISSANEIDRWFGIEILEHGKGAIDYTRMKGGLPILVNHGGDQVGVIEPKTYRVDDDEVMRGWAKFSRSVRGSEIEGDVEDRIRSNTSIGYFILEWEHEERDTGKKDANKRPITVDVYRITKWQPAELSLVNIPADTTVGVGRSVSDEGLERKGDPIVATREARVMDEEAIKAAAAAAKAETERAAAAATANATATATAVGAASKNAAEIVRMCEINKMPERAAEFIEAGLSSDQAARKILDEVAERTKAGKAQPAAEQIGNKMEEKDRRRYSMARAIRLGAGMVARERGDKSEEFGAFKFDGLEAEVHAQLAQDRARTGLAYQGGILVPMDLRSDEERWQAYAKRTLDSKTLTKGTETVFEQPGEMIELLRAQAVVSKLGARTLGGLTGPVAFVKQTGGLTVYWVGENPAADVPESDVAFGLVNMTGKTLQATTAYSRQLLVQSSLDIEAMIREEFSIAHALKLDKTAFYGSGTNGEPLGIYKSPDVNVRAVGGAPDLDDVVQSLVLMMQDNASISNVGWAVTPGIAAKLRTTQEFSGTNGVSLWQGRLDDGSLIGYRAMATNQLSSVMTGSEETGGSEHGAIVGNWNDLIIGLFQSMELIVDPYARKKRGLIEVTSFQMADMVLRHGESFTKWTGATA